MEVWKKINGFENYEISNLGRVKGLKVEHNFGKNKRIFQERINKGWSDKKGYLYHTFFVDKKSKHILIHRLVALTFIPNPENKPQVNHINGIKSDNRVENLEWNTAKENLKHARDTGLNLINGVNHHASKLKTNDIKFIRKSNLTQSKLANIYKISQTTVSRIKLNKTYKNV